MRKLISIAWLDFKMGFADKSEWVFFLVLPVMFTLILAATMSGGSSGGDNRYVLAVVDADRSALSAQLAEALAASDVVRPVPKARDEADALVKDGKVPAALVIPAGFGEALMAGRPSALTLSKAPNDTRALAVEQAVRTAADRVSNAVVAANASVAEAERVRPFADATAKQAYFLQALTMAQELLADPPARVETTYAPEVIRTSASPAEQSSVGQLITWVSIPLIGIAGIFIEERRLGTLRRLLAMPVARATILAGKIGGRLIHGMVQMTLLILFGALILGVNWGRSPLALAVMMLAFALAFVAFGVLVGTIARTQSQANWMAISSGMLMAALGGAWWPLEITPKVYQQVVRIFPTTWAMSGFSDIVVRGQGIGGILPEVGVLLAFAAVFFGVGLWYFRYE
ncbi:MAG: ABC transporter permease [Chloroflexi bacterium]|nr:ABC transporter permease [Chloroflexota bacterium]